MTLPELVQYIGYWQQTYRQQNVKLINFCGYIHIKESGTPIEYGACMRVGRQWLEEKKMCFSSTLVNTRGQEAQ